MKNKLVVFAGLVLLVFSIAVSARADIVHEDDVIISRTSGGSLCVGLDCVEGESFGSDTIRIKDNNCRIHFEDTSGTTFPTRDWRITINDSTSGGGDRFSIDDIDGGTTPFTIEGGAPGNSLYVDDEGQIGLGTNVPVVEVHITSGDTPAIRFEQDGSISGFDPQTWDIAGNETNFFIRDSTNGSLLPFRINPGAPTNSIYIASTGNVGLGTENPDSVLHIEPEDGNRNALAVVADGGPYITLANTVTGKTWYIAHENNSPNDFLISHWNGVSGAAPMRLTSSGDLTITGDLTANGQLYASSKSIKEDFEKIDKNEILKNLNELQVSKWKYKTDKDEVSHIGPMAEDFHALFGLNGADKSSSISVSDIVGITIASVQELNNQIGNLKAENVNVKTESDQLKTEQLALTENSEELKTEIKEQQTVIENLKVENKQLNESLLSLVGRQEVLEDMFLALSTNLQNKKLVKYDGPGLDEVQNTIQ